MHLGIDISINGAVDVLIDPEALDDETETCVFDVVASRGTASDTDATLDAVGAVFRVTRERARQVEESALEKLRRSLTRQLRREDVDVHEVLRGIAGRG